MVLILAGLEGSPAQKSKKVWDGWTILTTPFLRSFIASSAASQSSLARLSARGIHHRSLLAWLAILIKLRRVKRVVQVKVVHAEGQHRYVGESGSSFDDTKISRQL